MKCPYCGAEVSADSKYCEFCHALNPEWEIRNEKREFYDKKRKKTEEKVKKEFKTLWRDKLAVRFMYGAIALFAGIIAAVFIAAFFTEGAGKLRYKLHRNEYEKEMAALYEEGKYGELYSYMSDRDLCGEDYYTYTQISLRYYDLCKFRNDAYIVIDCIKNGNTLRYSSTIDSMLYHSRSVLEGNGDYKTDDLSNKEILNDYREEVRLVLKTYCKLTDEEIDELPEYSYSSDYTNLIMERAGIKIEKDY